MPYFLSQAATKMNTEICLKSVYLDKLELSSNDFVVSLNGDITLTSATQICAKLYAMDKKGLPFIPFVINSDGGDVDGLTLILSCMDNLLTPVATITLNKAVSCAAVIFAYGSHNMKYMGSQAYLMFHESASTGPENVKNCDIKAMQTHMAKVDKEFNKKITKHLGLTNDFFDSFGHVDTYLSAKEAQRYGLCDHVGLPTIRVSFGLSMEIDVRKNCRQEISDPEKRPYKYQKFLCDSIIEKDIIEEE
tara:strand:- start:637 stop:1380 length:744 start_codon:yes stop_codon:yes gene_type:complete